ncbi:hypothetical protein QBC36DRAFT_8879 [Triangularia setosa]|uniref:Uncharacterized protein n=1 Tax=Triangularia setosa TaxID=2587417 RepID=A0AAN7A8L0_9PEZI|nr:hypothetical protein QBC36DRAFT_8879 [Podospora setosa]
MNSLSLSFQTSLFFLFLPCTFHKLYRPALCERTHSQPSSPTPKSSFAPSHPSLPPSCPSTFRHFLSTYSHLLALTIRNHRNYILPWCLEELPSFSSPARGGMVVDRDRWIVCVKGRVCEGCDVEGLMCSFAEVYMMLSHMCSQMTPGTVNSLQISSFTHKILYTTFPLVCLFAHFAQFTSPTPPALQYQPPNPP